jgi:hypothetical protein
MCDPGNGPITDRVASWALLGDWQSRRVHSFLGKRGTRSRPPLKGNIYLWRFHCGPNIFFDFSLNLLDVEMAKTTTSRAGSSPSIGRRNSDRKSSITSSILPEALEGALLCTIHEIEHWQHDNEYLLAHYRRVSNSYLKSLKSLFYLHNQTGNIYSHLIGVFLFISWANSTFNDLLKRYPTSDLNDILVFGGFFAGALTCFGLSAFFHTFGNHSHEVYHSWLLLDLYGIFALIVGTVFSATYYGFYCERIWWKVYSIGVSHLFLDIRQC